MASSRRASASTGSSGFLSASEMDKYRLISNIGKGSFGVISKIQRIEDGKEFALKELDYGKMNEKDRKQIMAEVAILESLKHRNIVQLVQKIRDTKSERIFIIMEYCTSGDLGSLIRRAQRNNAPLNEDRIWNVFLQITLALHHCHWPEARRSRVSPGGSSDAGRTQVLHRDLKPENVFLSGEFVKLGDFGLSKDMGGHMFTQTYVGTPLYMPPEILAENRYDTKSDIWSLGCLVYEMCALHSPFHTARTQEELISMVKSGKLPPLPSHISPALKLVIKAMLNLNPVRRPSTKDLLDMEEMKLHRKLFTVQNQTSVLTTRKAELEAWEASARKREERIKAKVSELEGREFDLSEREETLNAREAEFNMRCQQLSEGEEILRENQRRMEVATETLKAQWAALRSERERVAALGVAAEMQAQDGKQAQPQLQPQGDSDFAPARPPLEERKTMPIPSRHAAYDTPSKIPTNTYGYSSPLPLDSKIASKISRLNSRPTPSSGSSLPRRLASKSLTNLTARARLDAAEELGQQATPAKQRLSPGHLGRTSIGSPGELAGIYDVDVTMRTASCAGSPAPSHLLGAVSPFVPRPRQATPILDEELGGPPTLIPMPTFVYRPDATPAKWNPDDPDAPSPFIRKSGPATYDRPAQPNFSVALASGPSSQASGSGSSSDDTSSTGEGGANGNGANRPSSREHSRPPLSSINPQPAAAGAAAQPRKLPRTKSNASLHHAAVVRNAATVAGAMGSAVRTRPVVGRDPSRV